MNVKQIEAKIGTLSNPDKMPAYSWGISAKRCITGTKLAEQDGTVCSKCYANKVVMYLKLCKMHKNLDVCMHQKSRLSG